MTWMQHFFFNLILIQNPLNIWCPICQTLHICVDSGCIAFFFCITFFTACYCHLVFDCYHHKRYRLFYFVICSIISCFTTSLHNGNTSLALWCSPHATKTLTGLMEKWLVPHACQCSITPCNFWLDLKWSASHIWQSLKIPSIWTILFYCTIINAPVHH